MGWANHGSRQEHMALTTTVYYTDLELCWHYQKYPLKRTSYVIFRLYTTWECRSTAIRELWPDNSSCFGPSLLDLLSKTTFRELSTPSSFADFHALASLIVLSHPSLIGGQFAPQSLLPSTLVPTEYSWQCPWQALYPARKSLIPPNLRLINLNDIVINKHVHESCRY
jgi:hypothetical protein